MLASNPMTTILYPYREQRYIGSSAKQAEDNHQDKERQSSHQQRLAIEDDIGTRCFFPNMRWGCITLATRERKVMAENSRSILKPKDPIRCFP